MDALIKGKYELWLEKAAEDEDVKKELEALKEDEKAIEDAFYKDLEFGTGGLRGVIGAGTNRMNIHTVAKATQGYSNYLLKTFDNPSVSIAYDSRIKSEIFARKAAEVFAANGIKVNIYRTLMPTPSLSFAIRHLSCSGGIVVTASHNPAKYNGYKVYGPDGCQITTESAKAILKEISDVDIFNDIKSVSFDQGLESGMISWIGEDTITAFIDAVSSQSLTRGEHIDRSISITYTPLYGAGLACVTRCLKENGFTNVNIVAEQAVPNGNFPTCPYPNPEIREALELGLREAKKNHSDLLLATDPDCDRVGIAVKSGDDYVLLTGNEVGILLLDFIAKRRLATSTMPKDPIMVKTIVTIDMAKRIASDYGIQVVEVLTGFKYIGEQIGLLEKQGCAERYILGFEESYGYLTGSYVRDKDAVDGSLMICEMFAYYRSHGLSLIEVLEGLYEKYGYCLNTLHSYTFEGKEGFAKMNRIMEGLRTGMPGTFLGRKVLSVNDYKQGTVKSNGKTTSTGLPVSDVLKFILDGNMSIVARPSGTEPKLKLYLSISAKDREEAAETEQAVRTEMEKIMGI